MSLIATASARRRSARRIIWEDDFAAGLLASNWYAENRSNHGTEEQFFTPRAENARVENGILIIEAQRETYGTKQWTSARLNTAGLHAFLYGRIEARMKLPVGIALFPAFWTLGSRCYVLTDEDGVGTSIGEPWPDCGEIDIMEAINSETYIYSAIHATGVNYSGTSGALDRTDWHTYAVEWTETSLTFYVDGTQHWTRSIVGIPAFHHPHHLMVNLSIGGSWAADSNLTTPSPSQVLVDWVRVYAPEGTSLIIVPSGLALDKSAVNLTAGGATEILSPAITPSGAHDKGVKWSTSNAAVAVVGGGYVSPMGVGTCTITATTWNGYAATCTVTVT